MTPENSDLSASHKLASRRSSMRSNRPKPVRSGESIPSIVVGVICMALSVVEVAALIGFAPGPLSGLVERGTVVLRPPDPIHDDEGKFGEAAWYVPKDEFWLLIVAGLVLASLGILLGRRNLGRPLISSVGFGCQTLVLIASYILFMIDGWGPGSG